MVSFVVEAGDRRLDKVIRDSVPNLSRTQGQHLIEAERVTVDGQPRKPAYRVAPGERITISLPPAGTATTHTAGMSQPQPIPLDILHEDEQLLVLSKPAGMVVHPAPGHLQGTLVNALLAHHPPIAQVGPRNRAGIVHRLDRETSGVLVVAKQDTALRDLQEQFRNRQVEKTYLALVRGRVKPPHGIIEVPIGRDPRARQRMAPLPGGRYARTQYRVIKHFVRYTLLELQPATGRTHQIRVHLSWFGYPVVGDSTYGRPHRKLLGDRHFLHALRLGFAHPATGQKRVFEAPLPPELQDVLHQLRSSPPTKQT